MPADIKKGLADALDGDGMYKLTAPVKKAVKEALAWEHTTRKASVRTTISIKINKATEREKSEGADKLAAG